MLTTSASAHHPSPQPPSPSPFLPRPLAHYGPSVQTPGDHRRRRPRAADDVGISCATHVGSQTVTRAELEPGRPAILPGGWLSGSPTGPAAGPSAPPSPYTSRELCRCWLTEALYPMNISSSSSFSISLPTQSGPVLCRSPDREQPKQRAAHQPAGASKEGTLDRQRGRKMIA
jgi:hypothetical protein